MIATHRVARKLPRSFRSCRINAEISGGVSSLSRSFTFTIRVPPTTVYGTSFSSSATSACRRPMKRLIEYTACDGLSLRGLPDESIALFR